MSEARDQILGGIRRSLKRGPLDEARGSRSRRSSPHQRAISIPARAAGLDHAGQIELFIAMAQEVQTTVRASRARRKCRARSPIFSPAKSAIAAGDDTDPQLDDIPWEERTMLELRRGRAEDGDAAGLTGASPPSPRPAR